MIRKVATIVFGLSLAWSSLGLAQETEGLVEEETPTEGLVTEDPNAAAPSYALTDQNEYLGSLDEGKALLSKQNYLDACLKFYFILSTGSEDQPYYKEAEFYMGVALYNLSFYRSSYAYFDVIADAGPSHPMYFQTLKYLVLLHREMPGSISPMEKMASYDPNDYPKDLADEILFAVGKYWYYQGDVDNALFSLSQITKKDEMTFIKARFLSGVIYVMQNEAKPAITSFKDILRFIQKKPILSDEMYHFEQLTLLTMGRAFFANGQYEVAIKYYDLIDKFGEFWVDSLFESAWAYFHLENYPKALGNLQTLNSPYYEEEYYPEASTLGAVIMFQNCRYDDTLTIVDQFIKDYYKILKELEAQLAKFADDPNAFYYYLAKIAGEQEKTELTTMSKKIFNAALTDNKLKRVFKIVVTLSDEMKQLEELQKYPPAAELASTLYGDILADRELLIGQAGELAHSRLKSMYNGLKKVLLNAFKIRTEIFGKQKSILMKGEEIEIEGFLQTVPLDEEHVAWPFEGEYWKDELDSYIFNVESLCPAKDSPVPKGKKPATEAVEDIPLDDDGSDPAIPTPGGGQ